jgi:GTPase Era involved in 16S rRNA processing
MMDTGLMAVSDVQVVRGPGQLQKLLVECAKQLNCRAKGFPALDRALSIALKPLVVGSLRQTPRCVVIEDLADSDQRMYRFLQELCYVPSVYLIVSTTSRGSVGFLRKLLWDPREVILLGPLSRSESQRVFDAAADRFDLRTLDLDDFRAKVVAAARGNPVRSSRCAVSRLVANIRLGVMLSFFLFGSTCSRLCAMSEIRPQDIVCRSLDAVGEICDRYQKGALKDFLGSCRSFAEERFLNVAVLGRFKAGKSTLLNHLLGRPLLPVGVVPVTTVVTEIQEGPRKRAEVHFLDGHVEGVPVEQIVEFIAERHNPENSKEVSLVRVELPYMERYRGIRFVDTPGLESILKHNTDASMGCLPNVGLALVAVGVDLPLSQHVVELIRNLNRYTPNVSLLLTKVDVLDEGEQAEVQNFVRKQLARYWNGSIPILPYSAKPGFERFRSQLHDRLLAQVSAEAAAHRAQILHHKVESLVGECIAYLNVALSSAEVADSERTQL